MESNMNVIILKDVTMDTPDVKRPVEKHRHVISITVT